MSTHDDDDWPTPADDPEVIENAKRQLRKFTDVQRRALRWAYFGIAILVILIVILATR